MSHGQRQPLPKGTIIEFCGEQAEVLRDEGGDRLTVRVDSFEMDWRWEFEGCAVPSCQSLYPSRPRIYKEKETQGSNSQAIVSTGQREIYGEPEQPLAGRLHHQSCCNR